MRKAFGTNLHSENHKNLPDQKTFQRVIDRFVDLASLRPTILALIFPTILAGSAPTSGAEPSYVLHLMKQKTTTTQTTCSVVQISFVRNCKSCNERVKIKPLKLSVTFDDVANAIIITEISSDVVQGV